MKPVLYLVGTPLQESLPLNLKAREVLKSSPIIIGESRRQIDRRLKESGATPAEVFALDHLNPQVEKFIKGALKKGVSDKHSVALFSDCGMPVLFDPGAEVLRWARELGYEVHTVAGATSWSTACAASGFSPPFTIRGFLPQKKEERVKAWRELSLQRSHSVLLETPYRFRLLLEEASKALGKTRPAFLAWEIESKDECLVWGTLAEIEKWAETHGHTKGEFILILEAK